LTINQFKTKPIDEKQKVHALEEDIRNRKSDIWQDFEAVKQKVQQTKNELRPTKLVRQSSFLVISYNLCSRVCTGIPARAALEFANLAQKLSLPTLLRKPG
jgi:hypothetical protein